MQREETIDEKNIPSILDAIFEGEPAVYEAYSKYDRDIIEFPSTEALKNYIDFEISNENCFIDLAIHYPKSNGFVNKRIIHLKPGNCNEASERYSIEGWGLIQLHMDFKKQPNIKCKFAANTEKRANAWNKVHPELKSPELWEWKVVEKHSRRLIRILRKYA